MRVFGIYKDFLADLRAPCLEFLGGQSVGFLVWIWASPANNSNRWCKTTPITFIGGKTHFCRSNNSPIFSPKAWRPASTVYGPANFRVADFPPIAAARTRSCSRAFFFASRDVAARATVEGANGRGLCGGGAGGGRGFNDGGGGDCGVDRWQCDTPVARFGASNLPAPCIGCRIPQRQMPR